MPNASMPVRLAGAALVALTVTAALVGCASNDTGSATVAAPAVASAGSAQWVAASREGNRLILADRADVWSEAKAYSFRDTRLSVQSRFVKHQGTTCTYNLQFRNVGSTPAREALQVAGPAKAAAGMSSFEISVAPGATVTYGVEHRECPLRWGESKEMDKCAACQPILYFVDRMRAPR